MKTFKDFEGEQAIDKVIECSQYITPLISDKDIMGELDKTDIGVIGAKALKAHPTECRALREALGNEPAESALGEAYGIAQILVEIITDKDILDFFTSMNRKMKASGSVTENGEAEA